MIKVLCSTGCLIGRPVKRNFYLLKDFIANISCDGYELMFYNDWYEKSHELTAFMNSLGISVPSFHVEKRIGELLAEEKLDEALPLFEINCQCANGIGAKTLVLHLWNGIISDSNIRANYEAFGILNGMAKDYGLCLTVENVVCNHLDPLTHLLELKRRYPDIRFTFDTKMAAFHSQIDDVFKEENRHLWQNISHIHLNDYRGLHMDWSSLKTLHVGLGDIDFETFFENLKKIGYNGDFTVEATSFDQNGVIDFDLLNSSLEKVRQYAEKYGI